MPLSAGGRLGAYEVLAPLGAGGMGEVYRARDTKLGREVALKVILEQFAADADRVARFEREAKVLASLNHPRIAALYGLEQSAGQHFLVMELVEGETLADRLRRGPLPPEEAVAVALQIAEALEAAHERGIVHRDLKPANIKITPDDQIKVLDFGLAKAIESEAAAANVANSPTLSMMASQAGIILGTAAYMSPEQAKGFPADHRSDIFSFGSVLYEVLTGRQPFHGDTAPEVLASVLVRDADVARLPPDLNPRFADLVRRCLQKHPKRRWQAIGDVRAELEAIAAAPRTTPQMAVASVPRRPLWRRAIVPATCAMVGAALAAAAAWTLKPEPVVRPIRFSIVLPDGQRFTAGVRRTVTISPDGARIVYVADNRIYVRPIDGASATALAGTESEGGSVAPVFSPDGRSLAFYVRGGESILKRTELAGGSPMTLGPIAGFAGATWDTPGELLVTVAGTDGGIKRLPQKGGTPELIVPLDDGEIGEGPQFLPDRDTVLFTVAARAAGADRWESAQVVAYSIKSRTRKILLERATAARYVPTGHLLYVRRSTVFAIAFDIRRLAVVGEGVPVLEGVRSAPAGANSGAADFSVSDNGTLVYAMGTPDGAPIGLSPVLADREGRMTKLNLPPGQYRTPRGSPKGGRIALVSDDGKDSFIGTYDIDGNTALHRVTFSGKDRFPVWSPDGVRLAYNSGRDGDQAIFAQPADGTGTAERLTRPAAGEVHVPQSWANTPAGEVLLYDAIKDNEVTLWALSLKDRKSAPFGDVRSTSQTSAVFCHDGRLVAYHITGAQVQTYVQPFPATGAKYVVMPAQRSAPHHPLWAPDGRELFYVPTLGTLESVTVTTSPAFKFGVPRQIKRPFQEAAPVAPRMYDMMPDGRFLSFALSRPEGVAPKQEFHVVVNWFEELKAKVPR